MNPIILAIDTDDLDKATNWVRACHPYIGMIKIGLEFYLRYGRFGYHSLHKFGLPIMLDLKLHDIPNTVASAMRGILSLSPTFITVHASGGPQMIKAARDAIAEYGMLRKTKLIAVTVLTNLTNEGLRQIGVDNGVATQVNLLADMAIDAGADGVVCSSYEVGFIRRAHSDTLIITTGIRPSGVDTHDQSRPSTPQRAIAAGANHIVIGRPITKVVDPVLAAKTIWENLG